MLKATKKALLRSCETIRLSPTIAGSAWRRSRLLILAYHGISQDDEDQWSPELYMPASIFRERLETIKRAGCNVLPLDEAIKRLYAGSLPNRCVALTFDDGASDFYTQAYPLLQAYGYPATVYLTTYYCDYNRPVFRGACSYILWKRRGARLNLKEVTGEAGHYDLTTAAACEAALAAIVAFAERHQLSAQEKDAIAVKLARALAFDYERLLAGRLIHILSPAQVKELVERGVDIQLHTHRHRSPAARAELAREIEDNRQRIIALTGARAEHLCYPDGLFHTDYLEWLPEMGVRSATTCEPGLASANSHPMALPRLVDTSLLSLTEFKGWLNGISDFLPQRARRVAASR
ncbi:MAG: polysaccharide deacetylase family protein [Blastocatellia bacterium]